MSVTQISGLVSGLDTASLIEALVQARSGPIVNLQRRQAEKTAELTAWQGFEAVTLSLKIETERLANRDLWDNLLVSTTDEEHLTGSASEDAPLGDWTFHVEQLAVAHQMQSDAFGSDSELVGSGTFTLTVDGQDHDLTVAAGATVADLATQINDEDLGVSAALIRSEAGGVEAYHLVLTAEETGAQSQFSVDATGLSGGTAPDFDVNAPRLGADAIVEFGGEGGLQVHSATNTFTDIVAGIDVTVDTVHEDGDSTTLSVARDLEGLTTRVSEFVDRFNAVIEYQNQQFRFDPEVSTDRPPLMGSAQLISMTSDIRSKLLGPIGGLTGESFTSLAGIGLRAGADGTLSFRQTDFEEALQEDFDAVANLFRANASFDTAGVEWLTAPDGVDLDEQAIALEVTQAATRGTLTGDTIDLSSGIVIDETNDTFQISIEGQKSAELTLAHGTYLDGDSLASAIASAIADSEDLGALQAEISFTETATSQGDLVVSTARYGSAASIQLHSVSGSTFLTDLGLDSVAGVTASGQDVAGTINGITAEGNGRVLKLADDAEEFGGLSFRVSLGESELGTVNATFTEGAARKTTRLLSTMTESGTGTLARLGDSIQSIIDTYARDITLKQEQLEIRRARLERRYASLESTLGQLQSQGQFLSAQAQSLSGNLRSNR